MIDSTRKANNILSILMSENGPDDLVDNLYACLKAAAVIHLAINEIAQNRDKVNALARVANDSMFSLIAKWEKENG